MSRFAVAVVPSPHAGAFGEVAEGLYHALNELGHDALLAGSWWMGTRGASSRRTIVLGWNVLSPFHRLPPETILWNLEQASSRWLDPVRVRPFADRAWWDWSPASSARLADAGVAASLVPVGYAPELTRIEPAAEQDIDVLFYGSLNERRSAVLEELRQRFAVAHLFGVYGAQRDQVIARAKVHLNMHYYDRASFEVVRVSYLLANRCAIVSEQSPDAEDFAAGVAFASYERLVERCAELVGDARARRELGEKGLEIMRARPQAGYLRSVLA